MTDRPPFPDPTTHAFFLDFDGTLAPIVDHPESVHMPGGTRAALEALHERSGGALAIVTGRALADLVPHLRGMDLILSGSHGHEVWHPGDPPVRRAEVAPVLAPVDERLTSVATRHNLTLERKPGAITVHYRGMPHLEEIVREAVDREADGDGTLKALHGNMVSEVVLAAAGKGAAIRSFLEAEPFAGRRPVMIGDDVTDEDGFEAAEAIGGFGIKIGGAETRARYRLASVDALADWLSELSRPGAGTT
ncbi:trehalose-phosphatase [Roseivivax halodurans JCM 10272]|uniref:Trehalose 6-phosphate phosphatase n=1 Tax=Roseivivax halodurans JCM 10272 TaxID=1449350 RepID=X7EEL6_9RHOB|nr:trehalose-phosphatase [Roseivivax halodurans]ETX14357.1 trehalose-phosphatase [Roseivivax halodurans JCM 10272]